MSPPSPIVVERAEGARIRDVDGKSYIDFAGGIGCQNTGHGFAPAVAAIHEQVDSYLHQCFMVGIYEPYIDVCRRLAELSPCAGERAESILLNSGAEAIENAVKIARAATGRPGVVVFENAFHGRTLLTMTMTHKHVDKQSFGPFAPEVYRAPGPYPYRGVVLGRLPRGGRKPARASPESVACVVLEPVQGEGGFILMPEDFPARLEELLARAGHPLRGRRGAVGRGPHRTGLGDRALRRRAGPARLGQVARRRSPAGGSHRPAEVMDAPAPGGLGGTFGGSPVACAAAVAVLDEVASESFRSHAVELGEKIRVRLDEIASRLDQVGEVRGLGPMLALELVTDRETKEPAADLTKRTTEAARESGLILLSCGTARKRDPHPRTARHLRRRPRPGPRDPGGVPCRQPPADVRLRLGLDEGLRRGSRRRRRRPRGRGRRVLHDARPSGSGKTTTLRLIAGFELPDDGRVLLNGADVTRQPPYARDVNTVFQDYALFPHLSVADNVAYGMKVKGVKRAERRRAPPRRSSSSSSAATTSASPQLSGGQRQRVALARAIVNRPQVLLLDEPLGALDLKLRQEMQIELKRIQQQVGITFVYVTHDQDEALTMSDRLAVFDHGRIKQIGTPAEVYERPASAFVAGFVGVSNVVERQGRRFAVRPEKIRMSDSGTDPARGSHAEKGRIRDVVYAGMLTRYVVELDGGGELQVVRQNLETSSAEALDTKGREVVLEWRPEHQLEIDKPGETEGET